MATARASLWTARFKLDFNDNLVLKGAAIAAIVLHNYFHLAGSIRENEFDFDPRRYLAFLQALRSPALIPEAGFAFLGHYGVQVFIFLSAYGLATRYWDAPPNWREFLWSRVKKIYPTFLLAVALWIALAGFLGGFGIVRNSLRDLALTICGVQNLVPGSPLPPVGPWWFLPFIMQFYCLWPVVRRLCLRYGIPGLIAVSAGGFALTYFANDQLNARWSINLLETPLGHMPEICLGVAAARYALFPALMIGPAAILVLWLANAYRALWPFGSLAALLLVLCLYPGVSAMLKRSPVLAYLGVCSMPLFFVNGFTRNPFLALAEQGTPAGRLLLGIGAGVFAVVVAQLISIPRLRSGVGNPKAGEFRAKSLIGYSTAGTPSVGGGDREC